ncbi:MAG: hypothetical protein ACP5HK_02555 [Acidilobus sp.]
MGKFERDKAEALEKGVVDVINGTVEGRHVVNDTHRCADKVAKLIINDATKLFGGVRKAFFIGRKYSEPGDIKLLLNNAINSIAYIELKLIESGKGTRANIGQDTLTEFGLFRGTNALSWSQFRERSGFNKAVSDLLNQYQFYDKNRLQRYSGYDKERKARYLRDLLGPNPGEPIEKAVERAINSEDTKVRSAAEIVGKILYIARQDKLNYIRYLKTLEQDQDATKKLTILLLLGVHGTRSLRRAFSTFDDLISKLQGGRYIYMTYYVRKGECAVCRENLVDFVKKRLLKASSFRVNCREYETNCLIEYEEPSSEWKPLLRVVFHWKNVFQGIATPCLNVFDAGELESICSSASDYV